jgi:hypothetical protein
LALSAAGDAGVVTQGYSHWPTIFHSNLIPVNFFQLATAVDAEVEVFQ